MVRAMMNRGFLWVKGLYGKIVEFGGKTKALGKDDPRRVIHSLKLGLTLTIVSLLYYYNPIYSNFGVSAMWALITVVVVFEFSVGATLGKGLNRAFATLFGGGLGVGAHYLAALCGHVGQPIITIISVFVLGSIVTFMRFFPSMKAKYDYGMMISILTFGLVTISGIRDHQILLLLQNRISTTLFGVGICVFISISISPVWAGQDLHNRIALNIHKLAIFFEGDGRIEYLKSSEDREGKDGKLSEEYKSILKSSGIEETLYNYARWEPGHGCFKFGHPWKQYLKIGAFTYECAFAIHALHRNLSTSNIQVSEKMEKEIQEACIEMSMEIGKALRQLVSSIREMTQPTQAQIHTHNSKAAANKLKASLTSSLLCHDHCHLSTLIPTATLVSLLVDVVQCTENIADAVQELASLAHFKISANVSKNNDTNGVSFLTIPISTQGELKISINHD